MDSWKSQRLTCKRKAPRQNCTVHRATSELAFHRWPGSRAGRSTEKMVALQEPLCWKLLMLSSLRRAPQIRPSACPCKMSTRLEVRAVLLWAVATVLAFILAGLIALTEKYVYWNTQFRFNPNVHQESAPYQLAEWRPGSWNPAWWSPLLRWMWPPRSSLSKCTTRLSMRHFLATTWALMSRMCPSRTSVGAMSLETAGMTHLKRQPASPHRCVCRKKPRKRQWPEKVGKKKKSAG